MALLTSKACLKFPKGLGLKILLGCKRVWGYTNMERVVKDYSYGPTFYIHRAVMSIHPEEINDSRLKRTKFGREIFNMREHLKYIKLLKLQERRRKLFELCKEDMLQEEKELNQVGLGYMNNIR